MFIPFINVLTRVYDTEKALSMKKKKPYSEMGAHCSLL